MVSPANAEHRHQPAASKQGRRHKKTQLWLVGQKPEQDAADDRTRARPAHPSDQQTRGQKAELALYNRQGRRRRERKCSRHGEARLPGQRRPLCPAAIIAKDRPQVEDKLAGDSDHQRRLVRHQAKRA
jgi:hypothetical protein